MIKRNTSRCSRVRDSGCSTPALDRALALLELVSESPGGVTQSALREELGFSGNLVFRLTKSLMFHGYLECNEHTRRFVLTGKLLSLAQPRFEDRSLVQVSQKPLRRLRDATGESAHIGVRCGLEVVVLDRVVGPHPFKCYVEVGARGLLHNNAPGKILLAWLPEEELKKTLNQMDFVRCTATTITSRKEFEKHLQMVRERGYAMDLGENVEGHHCVGAPVFDVEGRPIASVWLTAPAARITEAAGEKLAPAVMKTGEEITNALCGRNSA